MSPDIFKAVVLGIVEGVTEFLPISSTGHLIVVNQWISFGGAFTVLFDVVIQLGAILAVVVGFFGQFWPFRRSEQKRKEVLAVWGRMIVGVLPALVVGFLAGEVIEENLFTPLVVATTLILGGLILLYAERRKTMERFFSTDQIHLSAAFWIGLAQCTALIPGVSRSAATIIAGLLLGLSRATAAEFSFFLAVPTMAAASLYSLLKYQAVMSDDELKLLTIGFLVSFLVALAVLKIFMRYIKSHSFRGFAYYRIILGALLLFYFWQ
ncbi:MAG: undecaprenyl-diphosphate phosphatase [Patescibacteria group bacterium]